VRFLFITDDDVKLHGSGTNKRLLWQLFVRFDVGRDLHFDPSGTRVAWDATAPIPHPGRAALEAAGQPTSEFDPDLPVRSWPAITLHNQETIARTETSSANDGYDHQPWSPNVTR